MTAPKATVRRRRLRSDTGTIPQHVAAWFAGQHEPTPWEALLPDEQGKVPIWWRKWLSEHPGAMPPPDCPWIQWEAAA